MQIYCFDVDDNLDWPTGTAVAARDRRTASSVLLYRSLESEPQTKGSHSQSTETIERRRRARAILDSLPAPHPAQAHPAHPILECFSCNDFIALAAPNAEAAKPALEKLRAEGLFLESPKSTPPPPVVCSRCHEAKPLIDGVCIACAQPRAAQTVAPPKSRRSGAWLLLCLAVVLIPGALYLFWPKPATQTTVPPPPAPTVQFGASQRTVRKGARVVLSWNTSGLTSLSISPGIGPVAPSGERSVVIRQDTTFTLFATGPGYNTPVSVSVSVIKPQPLATIPAIPVVGHTEPTQPNPAPQPQPRAVPQSDAPATQTVREALDLWAAAYRANDPQRQASLYASRVDRFFLRENVDNNFVLNYMISFYGRGTRFIAFSFSTPEITADDSENVKAMFTKHYTIQLANGELRYVNSRSELHLTRIQGLWKITFERDFKSE